MEPRDKRGNAVHSLRRLPRAPASGLVSHVLGAFRQSTERAGETASYLCLAAAAVSLCVLAGWIAGPFILARGHTESGPMSPETAAYFLALALALYNHNRVPASKAAGILLAATGAVVPLLAFIAPAAHLRFFGPPAGAWAAWMPLSLHGRITFVWLGAAMALCPLFAHKRSRGGDVLGAAVLLLSLMNALFIMGYLHGAPLTFSTGRTASSPFLSSVNALLLGFAVLARLGPRYFPLSFLSGSSVRAVLLRHFLPVTAAAVLVYDLLGFASHGRGNMAVSSFLVLVMALLVVVALSLRSADVISERITSSLQESEERYAVLVDNLKEHAVVLLDPAGSILTWNAGAERILGYREREVLGDPVSRFSPAAEQEEGLPAVLREAAARGAHEEQGWRVKKGGHLFWAETVTNAFLDEKRAVLGFSQVIRDITVRREAEEVIREQAAFTRLLQAVTSTCNAAETLEEALPVVIHQICFHAGWPVGHAWVLRRGGEELLSGPWHLADEARFRAFREESDALRLPPDRAVVTDNVGSPRGESARAAGLTAGFAFPLKAGKKVTAVLEFFSDKAADTGPLRRELIEAICMQLSRVAEREEAERAVRLSERRFRSLTQTANDAIVSYDAGGRIVGWNRGAKAIFGYEETEVLGQPLERIAVQDAKTLAVPSLPPALLTDMAGKTLELTGRRKSGEAFPIDASSATWRNGGDVFFTAIMRDITPRKRAQALLTASLQEKEAMLKEIHHRVKNNLQLISSLLRLQSEKIQDPALLSLFLESQNRVKSMAMIHESLYQSPDLASIDFSDYVQKLASSLLSAYRSSPESGAIELDVDKAPLNLDVAVPCGLIITEMVSNALKYAYPKGKEGSVFIGFHSLPGAAGYELVVADKGVGMKKPVDFESTESLGLRLVYLLTEQLGGRIRMENGVGTKFVVTFKGPLGGPRKEGGTS